MKPIRYLLTPLFVIAALISCEQHIIEKPDNLIPADKMEDILYDLSLLNSIKGVDVEALNKNNISPTEFLYKKYHIDSLQFAKSSIYYASNNPEEYSKMFDQIKERLDAENKVLQDSIEKAQRDSKLKNDEFLKARKEKRNKVANPLK